MATPTALQTAATTALAVASGVTALWLTLGAMDRPENTAPLPADSVRVEYVDEAGNVLANPDDRTSPAPTVLVVDQFGEPYAPDQADPAADPQQAAAETAPLPAETTYEAAEAEHDEYEEDEGADYAEYGEHDDD